MRSFTCEQQGKKNSDRRDNRESKTPTSWKILVLDAQSAAACRRAHQQNLKTVARPHPADPHNQNRCQTTAARLSEVNARHATTSIFVQCGCVDLQLSSKFVDQRATIMVTRPCFAAADQQQTENRALALTFGSKLRRFFKPMSNLVPVLSLT